MRPKHGRDGNHGKHGWVGGNPRHGKARGNFRGSRQRELVKLRKEVRNA